MRNQVSALPPMTSLLIIRIDPETKRKATALAKAEGKNVSQVVRSLLDGYIRERDMGAYIDELWDRIGDGLKKSKRSSRDVAKTIKQVRQ